MASSSSSSPSPPPSGGLNTGEEQNPEQVAVAASVKEQECIHKTKIIQFLGRTTPIIMQNNNGPCPLLAICNVLLLRNNLNLSPDTAEVSQEKLLSLVAERIIDSNSNVDNKDAGYVENQQQNIADAIDLLPRLATGIDVNVKFRRIDDFEFTRECAIFDLLDIPLYHGWLVDFQDTNTNNAIGSKSYNTITSELVALETGNMESGSKNNPEEDCVDFAAATTATLGVPSPSLSRDRSFDDSLPVDSEQQNLRKGDIEEEAELLKALKLSETEFPNSASNSLVDNADGGAMSVSSDEPTCTTNNISVDSVDLVACHVGVENQNSDWPEPLIVDELIASNNENNDLKSLITNQEVEATLSSKTDEGNHLDQPTCVEPRKHLISNDAVEKSSVDEYAQEESAVSLSPITYSASVDKNDNISEGSDKVNQFTTASNPSEPADNRSVREKTELSCLSAPNADLDSCLDGSEPVYEGEECIMDKGTTILEEREPVYEGEMMLAGQAQQGELIRNFLKNNASQLTIYGLFCLQDGLKERELCVFFRNNHFSTMFKYDGELYLLATDQGYISEPDVVWEKLNEVKGDTQYMTCNFKIFDPESRVNSWDEQNVMTSTADYLASIDSASQTGLEMNSDLQLAIALQQQEFEQQPQPQRQNPQPQAQSITGSSRLVTGPQVRSGGRTSTQSPRADAKKDKCTIM